VSAAALAIVYRRCVTLFRHRNDIRVSPTGRISSAVAVMNPHRPPAHDTSRRYTRTAIVLHWTIASLVVGLLATGWWMTRLPTGSELQFALFQLHKSLGVTTLLLSLARLGWRMAVAPPPAAPGGARWAHAAARIVHDALLALTIATPLAGWAVVSASIWNIPTLLFGIVPWPHLPLLAELAPETKRSAAPVLAMSHAVLAYSAAALAALHAGAALFHHFIRADDVLARMLPTRTRRPS
jgi:cytochrome b561